MNEKTILIADDEKSIREMYKDRLSDSGFRVVFAKDGNEALDLVHKEKPILALLDIMMPNKSGMEVLEQIKNDPTISDTKVGILTVLDEETIQNKAFELGAKYYLVKSRVTPTEVLEIIKKEVSHADNI